jgi:hypothetical protein
LINNDPRKPAQVKLRLPHRSRTELLALASRRRMSVSRLLRSFVDRELAGEGGAAGSEPDESAIREMAILVAVELVLKLQEASIPGGPTLSRRLLEDAARAAIARVEAVELSLRREAGR